MEWLRPQSTRTLTLIGLLALAPAAFAAEPTGRSDKSREKVTYAGAVARILQDHCQTCHHPGTAAPFSLMRYDDAVKWSDTIREALTDRRMPPWHADPRYGKYSNDRRLKKDVLDTLLTWIDTGMAPGDKKALPPPRTFADGWVIGKPDVIFQLPAEQTVPAAGTVPYQYLFTPTNFKEDVWVQAAEARPTNREVVHHIIVSYRDPKAKGQRQGRGFGDGFIVGTAPGDMPLILPPGVARKIPAGAVLVWQMHYTPNGKAAKDRSQLGLIFYKGDKPPRWNALTVGVLNRRFEIPPEAPSHLVESDWTVPRDLLLLSFMPHMHLRGKDFEYRVTYPDGKTEILLSVPKYDFNWQTSYRLEKPVRLPKETKVHCTAHFDNSADNPANPDPKKTVYWGDQTWEEMMIGWADYMWEHPETEKTQPARN